MDRTDKKMILQEAKDKLRTLKDRYGLKIKLSVEEGRPIKIVLETSKIDFLENYIHTKSHINLNEWEKYIFENDYIFVDARTYQVDFTGIAKNCIASIYSNLSILNIHRTDVRMSTLIEFGHFVSIMIVLNELKNEDGTVPHSVSAKIKAMLDAGKKR